MPYPDNFNGRAFDLHYGVGISSQRINAEMRAARTLKQAAQNFLDAVKGLEFSGPEPTSGYDIEEIVGIVRDAAAIDLLAFEARLITDAMEGV